MNILYIWDADYPWDVRVEKICKTLAQSNHTIHIAARNLKRLPVCETTNGLHIHRLRPWKNERLNYVFSFPAFFSPIWGSFLKRIIQENGIEIIIVRDLPMAIAGIWAGKRHSIPVIFDMAEDYVSMIKDIWRARKFEKLNLLVRNPYLARLVERYVIKHADHILTVVDEARDMILKKGGSVQQVSVVGNTPALELFTKNSFKIDPIHEKKIKEHFSVIYTGGIQMGRGIQVVINALPILKMEIPTILFVIVGDGYAVSQLKELADMNDVRDQILWAGWIDHEKVYDYIRLSKVGIIPHRVSDQTNTTIPNKIFDYMGLGIPVVTSDAAPMKRIVDTEQCGLTFKSGDSQSFANTLLELIRLDQNYGSRGRKAVIEKYNWDIDGANLLNVIEKYRGAAHEQG